MAPKKKNMGGNKQQEENEEPAEVKEDAAEIEPYKLGNLGKEEEVTEEQDKGKGNVEEAEDEHDGGDEDDEGDKTEGEEADDKSLSAKKRSRKQEKSERGDLNTPRTPTSERPTRKRKTVDRFVVGEIPRVLSHKPLIDKGRGTQLKDIPNVAFKLSKRKADENLQLLHTVLFGKKSKVHTLKKNIGLFSGFVWVDNEEKQRAKIKEKLEKYVKEKLVDFCDVLNISVNKATLKKEALASKILEFLESPHATTDTLLAEKEKGKKRKSKASASRSPAGRSTKKQKVHSESGRKRSTEEDDDNKSESSQSESEDHHDDDRKVPVDESDQEEIHSEEETDGDQDEPEKHMAVDEGSSKKSAKKDTGRADLKSKPVSKVSSGKASKTGKSTKESRSSVSKKEAEAELKGEIKTSVTKKQKDEEESEKYIKVSAKGTSSSKKKSTNDLEQDQAVEGKSSEEAEEKPSKEEMHAVVANVLKEVDFNTVTLNDILRQLGDHFGVNLLPRKSEVKEIITDVIQNMSDDEDDEGGDE